ncbi:hypothetical protein JL720_1363 [Aureococcus anophagefferens]|nr:hypothetical protein JL720_1363 [Aureococcus anophagefferens]
MVVAVVAEAARAKKEAVVEGEPTIVALAKAMPASHAAAFIAGCVFTLICVGCMNMKLLDSDPTASATARPRRKMGECEANSVHLSKREKCLAEQGKKA